MIFLGKKNNKSNFFKRTKTKFTNLFEDKKSVKDKKQKICFIKYSM